MKLRTRIQCLFCIVIAIILTIVTLFAYRMNYDSSLDTLYESMATSSSIASDYIGQHLEDLMHKIEVVGESEFLTDKYTIEEQSAYLDEYLSRWNLTSYNILGLDGISVIDGTDFSDREYIHDVLNGESRISELTHSKYNNLYGISIAAPITDSVGDVTGVVLFRLDVEKLQLLLDTCQAAAGCYGYIVDGNGMIASHSDEELIQTLDLKAEGGGLAELAEEVARGNTGYLNYEYNGESNVCGYSAIENTDGWSLVIASSTDTIMASAMDGAKALLWIAIVAFVFALALSVWLANYISKPIVDIQNIFAQIAEGNLSTEIKESKRKDELGVLHNVALSLSQILSRSIGEANYILNNIAHYDLTSKDMSDYPGDFDTLSKSINQISAIFNNLIRQVQESIANVDTGAQQLTLAADALSAGTLTQANSIQLLEDNLTHIVRDINQSSENESLVNERLLTLDEQIRNGNEQLIILLNEVKQVASMSTDIQKIVDTIDSIALQTNILSLNASVEASRAGEMGRGFAVVAEEIRSLAEKSSEASKRTGELIDSCIRGIANAKQYADNTVNSLAVVVSDSAKIATAFEDISESTKEQATESNHIQSELHVISDVVQSNTATAEETAASCSVLSDQAAALHQLISNFKLK